MKFVVKFVVQLAMWLVRRACSEEHREEIEGDLLELLERKRTSRGSFRAGLDVFSEALLAARSRPSEALMHQALSLALVLTGVSVGIAYVLLIQRLAEPSLVSGPFVLVGTTLELLFLCLLYIAARRRGQRGRRAQ